MQRIKQKRKRERKSINSTRVCPRSHLAVRASQDRAVTSRIKRFLFRLANSLVALDFQPTTQPFDLVIVLWANRLRQPIRQIKSD